MDVCLMCSDTVYSSDTILIDEELTELLTFLFANIETPAIQNNKMCKFCARKVQEACDFKLHLKNFSPFIRKQELDATLCKCLICSTITDSSSASMLDFNKQYEYLKDYIPQEFLLQLVEDFFICVFCQKSLLNMHVIVNLLSVYEKIESEKQFIESSDDEVIINKEAYLKDCFEKTLVVEIRPIPVEIVKELLKKQLSYNKDCCDYNKLINKKELEIEMEENSLEGQLWAQNIENIDKSVIDKNNTVKSETNNKISNDTPEYRYRQNQQNGVRPFPCTYCRYRAKRKDHLQNHIRSIHKKSDYQTSSSICIKRKDNPESPVQIFLCKVCDFKTSTIQEFLKHVDVHKNIFQCHLCNYVGMRKSSLDLHMVVHREDC